MLEQLKFVQGAVAKKDFLPALTHFCIENGTVRGYNGTVALCSPIPFDIACNPKAIPMVDAIKSCKETVSLSMTPAGRLSIKSGSFKAFVECIEASTGHVEPEGEKLAIDGISLLNAIKALDEFVGEDASRPWANGILLKGQSAFATNNVIIVEYWTGVDFPITINIPRAAVREILRIGEAPEYAQATDTSLTLHYSSKRWIRTQLLNTDWPDMGRILDRASNAQPINPAIFDALTTVKAFVDRIGRVTFHEGMVCTSVVDGEGAKVQVEGLPETGSFSIEMLAKLQGVAQTIDFSTYPDPCLFYGDRLRGAIVGMRMTPT